jgi:hypothetical protein
MRAFRRASGASLRPTTIDETDTKGQTVVTKPVQILYPDGRSDTRETPPTFDEMQQLVGGTVEAVRVLEHVTDTHYRYTYVYVNEEALDYGLPRNAAATTLYQQNVRMQYPNAENPFLAAKEVSQQRAQAMGAAFIELFPNPAYDADPYLAGVAIYFQGWSCDEVNAYYNGDDEGGEA